MRDWGEGCLCHCGFLNQILTYGEENSENERSDRDRKLIKEVDLQVRIIIVPSDIIRADMMSMKQKALKIRGGAGM